MPYIHKSNPEANYTVVPNMVVNDSRISFKAKGILIYLLSKPDNWKVYIKEIAKHSPEGIKAVRTGINELIKSSYITRAQVRENGRIKEWLYFVYDTPQNAVNPALSPEGPKVEVEKVEVEKGTLLSTNSTKKEYTKYIYTSEETGKKYTLKDIYTVFIKGFNTTVGSNYKGSEKVKSKLKARLKDGYTPSDIGVAIANASKDLYLMGENDGGKRYLTPEYILRENKLDQWLNSKPKEKSIRDDYGPRPKLR